MNTELIAIPGFGRISEKQVRFEITYWTNLMQENYKAGRIQMAISAMKNLKPFVDALLARGYKIQQILPNYLNYYHRHHHRQQ